MGAGAGAPEDGGASNAGRSKNAEKSSPSFPGEGGYAKSGITPLFTWFNHESNDHGSCSSEEPAGNAPLLLPVGGFPTAGKEGLFGSRPMSRMRVWMFDWSVSMSALISDALW